MKDNQKYKMLKIALDYIERNEHREDAVAENYNSQFDTPATTARRAIANPKKWHGNTRIPFGLCKEFGIQTGDDWTPQDAWNALKDNKLLKVNDIWNTLQDNGNLNNYKKNYKSNTPRTLADTDLKALMPTGKRKITKDQRTMLNYIKKANSRYSAQGYGFPTDLFKAVGKAAEGSPTRVTIGFDGGDMEDFEGKLYYYDVSKDKIKIPRATESRRDYHFLCGTTYAYSSCLDYKAGENGKPASLKDKGLNQILKKYTGKNLTVDNLDWAYEAVKALEQQTNKKTLVNKAKQEEQLLNQVLAEDLEKKNKGEISTYAYNKKFWELLNEDDRFKNLKELDERRERLQVYKDITNDFIEALTESNISNKENRLNRMVSAYMAMAQIEPRTIGYLKNDMPDVTDAMDDYIKAVNKKLNADIEVGQ